jgi:hypothetical protein
MHKGIFIISILSFWYLSPAQPKKQQPAPSKKQQPAPSQAIKRVTPKMTLLLYMGGDDTVEPYTGFHCHRQLENEGAPADMNVVVYTSFPVPTGRLRVTQALLQGDTLATQWIYDYASPAHEIFAQALAWSSSLEHEAFGLIISSHGERCSDLTPLIGNADTLRQTLAHFVTTILKKPLAFIAFDTCGMSTLETAATVSPYTHYVIAAEDLIEDGGLPYNLILNAFKKGAKSPQELSYAIADAYQQYYQPLAEEPDNRYCLVVCNLASFDVLVSQNDALAEQLSDILVHDKKAQAIIMSTLTSARLGSSPRMDLVTWYRALLQRIHQGSLEHNPSLKALLNQGLALLAQVITHAVQPSGAKPVGGLAISLPPCIIQTRENTAQASGGQTSKSWQTFLTKVCKTP